MKIWIDLANSPQVLFFRPILSQLYCAGHDVFITSRNYAQTIALANQYGILNTPIGQHGGRKWSGIIRGNLGRVIELTMWARTKPKIDLAISHNSYTQAVAAKWLGIPFITMMDYEHQPLNHLCFRIAQRVIVPESFPDNMLRVFGSLSKARKYDGIKEEVYLADFQQKPDFLEEEGFEPEKVLVVVRPPAPWTAYHRFENALFDEVMQYLAKFNGAAIIFLPRIASQGEWARHLGIKNLIVPTKTLNGPNLLSSADVVISGGGTMNREAAVLGTPTYTVFKGRMGAVDNALIERGRMIQIAQIEDTERIRIQKKYLGQESMVCKPELVKQVTGLILSPLQ
jgi:uncharacterized protein